jgi:hypothetical protein
VLGRPQLGPSLPSNVHGRQSKAERFASLRIESSILSLTFLASHTSETSAGTVLSVSFVGSQNRWKCSPGHRLHPPVLSYAIQDVGE